MSVSYVTTQPMTLNHAIHRLKEEGCTVEPQDDCDCCAVVKDTDGNYFHLTDDIESYWMLSFDATEIHDGTNRVMGECYGLNDATRMAKVLDMVSEFEDKFHEIMGAAAADPEDED